MGAARDFSFGVPIDRQAYKPKNAKVGQKGHNVCHVIYFHNFGTVRDFKFGVRIDRQAYQPKNAKVGQKGRNVRHVTYFYNFATLFISLEWVKLQT